MRKHHQQADTLPAGELEHVERQLGEWRRTHQAPSRIPEDLWAKAADLATRHGICRVARALRLDYAVLKRRTKASAGAPGAMATFIELLPAPVVDNSIAECALEVESNRGARMRMVMKNVAPLGLASIIRDFVR